MTVMRRIYKNTVLVVSVMMSLFTLVSCGDDDDSTLTGKGEHVYSVFYQFELYDAEGNPYMVESSSDDAFSTCYKYDDGIAPRWFSDSESRVSGNVVGPFTFSRVIFSSKPPVIEPFVVKFGLMSDSWFKESGVQYVDIRMEEFDSDKDDMRSLRPVSWESDGLDVMYVKDRKISPEYIITCIGVRIPV